MAGSLIMEFDGRFIGAFEIDNNNLISFLPILFNVKKICRFTVKLISHTVSPHISNKIKKNKN